MAGTALLLAAILGSGIAAADTTTVSAVIPWQGQGQVFLVGIGKYRFLGSIEGIMYIESAQGELDEAFVECPIVQDVDLANEAISTKGNCNIVIAPTDSVFAKLTCEGTAGLCNGKFELISGTGRFTGISGAGDRRSRSPVHALVTDLTQGTELQLAAGVIQLPALKVSLP